MNRRFVYVLPLVALFMQLAACAAKEPPKLTIIEQECPCQRSWSNKQAYDTCVQSATKRLISAGVIDERRGGRLVMLAEGSACGTLASAR